VEYGICNKPISELNGEDYGITKYWVRFEFDEPVEESFVLDGLHRISIVVSR
jgi:hypothetical protein